MEEFKFIVKCERIGRRSAFSLTFSFNNQLVDRIKNLQKESRKWNSIDSTWELTTKALYELMKSYKNSTLIKFVFKNDEERKYFVGQLKKIDKEEQEKAKEFDVLVENKKRWLDFKEEIEKNYTKYEHELNGVLKDGFKLLPHQITGVLFLNKVRNALISHEMGLGKAQCLDSKILTPNGWIKMGDIKEGDFVIGSDGKPKKVLGVFPQGIKDIYKIKFNDGTSARSCDEHLWNVNTAIRNWRGNPFFTKTLREIMDGGLQYANGNNKWYIPIVEPIEFEEKDLKIDPYVLGCILGDGGITRGNKVSFTSLDIGIVNEIQGRLPNKHKLNILRESDREYNFVGHRRKNLILEWISHYSLTGCSSYTKFIPDDYKFSCIEQRLEILQGLLDTDGHSRKDGIIEITLASKQLIEDIQFIVQSLGGIGRLHDKWIKYGGEDRLYYRLHIKLPPQYIPFKLQRKINTFVAPTKYEPNRAIVNVEYVGKEEAQCILIDSHDHLYVTDNCVLTHNTLVSITYSELNKFEKVFVITPNSLKFNYYNEINKFTNSKAHIVGWNKNQYSIEESKYIIVNYEFFNPARSKSEKNDRFLNKWKKLGIDKIDTLICDENHKLKNMKSNTFKNFRRTFTDKIFRDGKVSKVFLSGTPAPNRAYELYSVLNQISPIDFPNKTDFYEYYCGMKYNFESGWGYEVNSEETKFEELFEKLSPYTHRKRKSEVLTDLPDKIHQRVMLDISDKELSIYNDIENGVVNEFVEKPSFNPLTIMIRLRQYTSQLKIKHLTELIDGVLESNEKVVIIDSFKESLNELHRIYPNISVLHTGDEKSPEIRDEMVKQFQDEKSNIKIFLASIQTANYGLTLTAANKMFILTVPYSYGEFDQVSSRCHRIGQKNAVNIYSLIFPDTIDDYVYSALESKKTEIAKVMDNENYTSDYEDSVLNEVINKIKRKHGA